MPTAPTTRFCRVCDSRQPLKDFMPGPVRYICRKHYYEQQHQGLTYSKSLVVYHAKKDCDAYFQGCCPRFNCNVARDVIQAHFAGTASPLRGVHLLPRDPTLPLGADNAFVCNAGKRRVLIDLWRLQPNKHLYMSLADGITE